MFLKYLAKIAGLSNQRVVLIFLGITVGYYFFGDFGKKVSELEVQIQTTQADLEKERTRLKETERVLKKAEILKGSVESLSERFKMTSKQLPTKISTTEIMRVIDSLAKTSGVIVRAKEPEATTKLGTLQQYPVKVNMSGSFSDLVMFMYYISNLEKVSRVSKFVISKPEADIGQLKSSHVKMDITVLGFEYIDKEEAKHE